MRNFLLIALALLSVARLAEAEAPAKFEVGKFTFTRPAAWEWVALSAAQGMRKAQLRVPATEGSASGEVVFFVFSNGAGGAEANVQRWLGQFEKPESQKTEALDVAGTKVTFVYAEGTFNSGMPGGPTTAMPGYALQGAILEAGEELVFVKMTGPIAVVKQAVTPFREMVTGAAGTKK